MHTQGTNECSPTDVGSETNKFLPKSGINMMNTVTILAGELPQAQAECKTHHSIIARAQDLHCAYWLQK